VKRRLSIIILLLLPAITHATTEYATFESFYKESDYVGWALSALIAGAIGTTIFVTGGTASPIVAGIGTWLGGLMGLSGAAATNAGLALLGGGSIASGGFGIAGGTALLTAAMSFGSEVVTDYTISKTISEYSYRKLADQSKDMLTLPLPENTSGPGSYKDAVAILEDIDADLPISSNFNNKVISSAIKTITAKQENLDADEESKIDSLLALLYFVSNNYPIAKEHANSAIMHARYKNIRRTLPAFIYATSSLYEENFDFSSVTNNILSYSVQAEPKNPLIPLLFSIYLDRMSLRFNDGFLDGSALIQVFNIMESPSIEDLRVENYAILLARYLMQLKLEQQKIVSIVNTSNSTIKQGPESLLAVGDSLGLYKQLITDSNHIMSKFIALDLDSKSRKIASEYHELLVEYTRDEARLASLVDQLKEYQRSLSETDTDKWYLNNFLLIFISIVLIFAIRRYAKARNQE